MKIQNPKPSKILPKVIIGSLAFIALISLICPTFSQTHAFDYDTPIQKDVSTQATVTVNPSISVAMDSSVSMETTPNANGAVTSGNANLRVTTNSTDGFRVLLNGANGKVNLTSTNPQNSSMIANATEPSTLANLAANTWAYHIGQSAPNSSSIFYPIPSSSTEIASTDTSNETQNYILSFGTKITPALPADSYSSSVIISAIANPVDNRNLRSISTMQEVTPEICARTPYGEEGATTLRDARDGKNYGVIRLADGNCWMREDLNLALSTSQTLTPNDSDISSNWTPSYNTVNVSETPTLDLTKGDPNPESRALSWDFSGIYYQIEVTNKICPKGWSLPDAQTSDIFYENPGSTSYANLLSHYLDTNGRPTDSNGLNMINMNSNHGYISIERINSNSYKVNTIGNQYPNGRFAKNGTMLYNVGDQYKLGTIFQPPFGMAEPEMAAYNVRCVAPSAQ